VVLERGLRSDWWWNSEATTGIGNPQGGGRGFGVWCWDGVLSVLPARAPTRPLSARATGSPRFLLALFYRLSAALRSSLEACTSTTRRAVEVEVGCCVGSECDVEGSPLRPSNLTHPLAADRPLQKERLATRRGVGSPVDNRRPDEVLIHQRRSPSVLYPGRASRTFAWRLRRAEALSRSQVVPRTSVLPSNASPVYHPRSRTVAGTSQEVLRLPRHP